MARQTLHAGALEEIGAVFQEGRHATLCRRLHAEGQIVLCGAGIGRQLFEAQIQGRQLLGRQRLQHEQHLGERVVGQVAFGLQGFDQLIERQGLVRQRTQGGVAHLGEEIEEARCARHLTAQHQGVHEEADQFLTAGLFAIGHRRTDQDVTLSAVARQQPLKGRQQHHVERGVMLTRQPRQAGRELGIEAEIQTCPTKTLQRRTRPVARQFQQGRRPDKLRTPVGQQIVAHRPLQPGTLLLGIFLVLQLQGRQRGRPPCHEIGIQGGHFAYQHRQRPAIGNQVMQIEQQHMLLRRQAQQFGAYQWAVLQIESGAGIAADALRHLLRLLTGAQHAKIGERQLECQAVMDLLTRLAGVFAEGGAQTLVACHHFIEYLLQ